MKLCSKCKEEKSFDEFHKFKYSKDGYRSQCKECRKKKDNQYYNDNREIISQKQKYFRDNNKELVRERKIYYYQNNKEKVSKKNKEYKEKNKEKLSEYDKKYREDNKDKIKEQKKEYRERPEVKERFKQWWKDNPEKKKEYRKNYCKEKEREHRKRWYKSFKERKPHVLAWRNLLNNTLKRLNKNKENETIKLLGYSAIELKQHIESIFLEGMSWENYGEWHIDHIKMVSEFDKETPVEVVNSLDNLRPLWASDNCSRKLN
jgi:hypothetical protein